MSDPILIGESQSFSNFYRPSDLHPIKFLTEFRFGQWRGWEEDDVTKAAFGETMPRLLHMRKTTGEFQLSTSDSEFNVEYIYSISSLAEGSNIELTHVTRCHTNIRA